MKILRNIFIIAITVSSCYTSGESFIVKPQKVCDNSKKRLAEGVFAGTFINQETKDRGLHYFIFYCNGVALEYTYLGGISKTIFENSDSLQKFIVDDIKYHSERRDFNTGGYEIIKMY